MYPFLPFCASSYKEIEKFLRNVKFLEFDWWLPVLTFKRVYTVATLILFSPMSWETIQIIMAPSPNKSTKIDVKMLQMHYNQLSQETDSDF